MPVPRARVYGIPQRLDSSRRSRGCAAGTSDGNEYHAHRLVRSERARAAGGAGAGAGAAGGSRGQCRRAQAYPASERDTRRWLAERSALGELLDADLETMGSMRPYQRRTRCWRTLRSILDGQQRHRCADGRTLHVRKVTRAEPVLREIYDALGLDPARRNAQDHDLESTTRHFVVPLAHFSQRNMLIAKDFF